jgi:hypothetical protein
VDSDRVHAHIDAARLLGDLLGVPVDCRFVERIDLRGVGRSTRCGYFLRDGLNRTKGATAQEDPRTFCAECSSDGTTDRSARTVDDGNFVL